MLVIEVDGPVHNNTVNQEYDDKRTEYLKSLGNSVIRFKNDEVRNSIEMVLERIKFEFSAEKPPLNPLLKNKKGKLISLL